MRSPAARAVFTVLSFVPLAGVLGIAFWAAAQTRGVALPRQADQLFDLAVVVLIGATAVAFVQIGLGIAVALHVTKRPDLGSGQRAGWTLACLFLGSFVLPVFSLVVLPGAKMYPPR